jgi:hypothetical protein
VSVGAALVENGDRIVMETEPVVGSLSNVLQKFNDVPTQNNQVTIELDDLEVYQLYLEFCILKDLYNAAETRIMGNN